MLCFQTLSRAGRFATIRVVSALLIVCLTASVEAAPYAIDILIDPYRAGVRDSWLFDINNAGQAAGYAITGSSPSGPRSAVLYRNGALQVLGGEPGSIRAVNDRGDAIGDFGIDGTPKFIAADGTGSVIGVPGNYSIISFANYPAKQLNNSGAVLFGLYPDDPAEIPAAGFSSLAIWENGAVQRLSVLDALHPYLNPPDPNDATSGPSLFTATVTVTGLNNAKQFAGGIRAYGFDPVDPLNATDNISTDTFARAYIYNGQDGYHLLSQRVPDEEIRPIDIDEAGTVFGWAGADLALWRADGTLATILPAPATALIPFGYADTYPSVQRNNLGQVMGITVSGGATLYDPVANRWTDITSTIAGLGTSKFSSIQGFNDGGQFVGLVRPPQGGGVFGFVVSPVPEPSSRVLAMILAAAGALALNRARLRGRHSINLRGPQRFATAVVLGICLTCAAAASEYRARFTGEVTEVLDNLNWFNDSIGVGMPVEGTYNFFDPGYEKQIYSGDLSQVGYRYYFGPGGSPGVPVLPVTMKLALGGHTYATGGGPVYYAIRVLNNSTGFLVGDGYSVQSPLDFPTSFRDWTGDPVKDPDGLFYPYLGMGIDLVDPTGMALSSTDLPLAEPTLANFASATGIIYIADGNGEPNYAHARFAVKTLQFVPEPSSGVLLIMAVGAGVLALKRTRSRRRHSINLPGPQRFATAVVLGIGLAGAPASAMAADFILTATGPFDSSTSQSFGFDGTTNVAEHLPSLYNAERLMGGSFTATYRFTTTDPPASGAIADYNFSPLQGLSYKLFDSNGAVVHVGGSSAANAATVFNNVDFAGTTRDTVNFFAFVNSVSGLSSPAALYQPQADFIAIQSFLGFTGAVTAGADFVQGLSLPIDPSVYLGFPNRTFRTAMSFNDGDTLDFLEPYQYVESSVQYRITSVAITAIPEPASVVMLGLGLLSATLRRTAAKTSTG